MEPFFPQLTVLHMNCCGIGVLNLPSGATGAASCYRKLSVLSLEDNGIASWDDIAPLGSLASLTRIHLSGNRLQEVKPPGSLPDGACGPRCPSLEALSPLVFSLVACLSFDSFQAPTNGDP
jgi:Leucine-rich repeat (LRR) protein